MQRLVEPFLVKSARFEGQVLVTGAGGCIGAWALAILRASSVPAVACDLSNDRRRPALVMGQEAAESLVWEQADISDYARLTEIIDAHEIRAVIHLAALQVPFCAAEPARGARVNVEGTINVLQAARERGIRRIAFASSIAALGMPPGGPWKETLYGAYKTANEHTAYVYWADWRVPSVCLRPGVVYGLARDQGMTSRNTIAIQAAAAGIPYEVPYAGPLSWLYAGEAAAAFIAGVSQDGDGAYVFDLNGSCGTVENGLEILRSLQPEARVTCTGSPLPFPADRDDAPLRAHVPDYPSIPVAEGIRTTYEAFRTLRAEKRMPAIPE